MPKTAITGSLVHVDLDKRADAPIYRQITDRLKSAIEAGELLGGSKLPSTRVFADELGVSRNTVLQVFEALTEEGYLISRVGAGTFVAEIGGAALGLVARELPPEGETHYPFRSLSRRGRGLVASATGEFSERPTPFMPDLPDLREFPIKTWLRLLNETSGKLTGQILSDTSNAGYEPLRRAVAQHVRASRGVACGFEQVIITTGSQQGIDLICRMLIDPGDPVWIEEPAYIGTRSVVRANGGVLSPVPVDAQGGRFPQAAATHPVPRLILATPSRHYPLGYALSQERREAVAQIAGRCGAWIVEDDYDHEFLFDRYGLRSLHALDRDARTIYVGTFSKVLLPSFRLGYIVVPPDLNEHFAKARAVVDRHASLIEQMVLSELMHRGLFVSHIRRMRGIYRARRAQLVAGLEEMFGSGVVSDAPEGGTHVVVPLRRGAADVQIARLLGESKIVVRPLSPYYMTSASTHGLLFGFAAYNKHEIDKGLTLLGDMKSLLRSALP